MANKTKTESEESRLKEKIAGRVQEQTAHGESFRALRKRLKRVQRKRRSRAAREARVAAKPAEAAT